MAEVQMIDAAQQDPAKATSKKRKSNSITKLGKDGIVKPDTKELKVAKVPKIEDNVAPKPKVQRVNKATARTIIKSKLGYSNNVKLIKNPHKQTVFAQCEFLGIDISSQRYGYPYVKKNEGKKGVADVAKAPSVTIYGCFYSYLSLLLALAQKLQLKAITSEEYDTLYAGLAKYFGINESQQKLPFWNNFVGVNVVASCESILSQIQGIEIDQISGLRDSSLVHAVLFNWKQGNEFMSGIHSFALVNSLAGAPLKQLKPTVPSKKDGAVRNKALQLHIYRRGGSIAKEDEFPDQFDSINGLMEHLYKVTEASPLKHACIIHHIYDKNIHLIRIANAHNGHSSVSKEMQDFATKDYEIDIGQQVCHIDEGVWGKDAANDIEILVVPRSQVTAANKRAEERKKLKETALKAADEDSIGTLLDKAIAQQSV